MCGRYVLISVQELAERYHLTQLVLDLESGMLEPRYNIAPGQFAPVVRIRDGASHLDLMKWGLVPAWSKSPKLDFPTFNARAEGLDVKATFRGPLRTKRCLVPADGFYEWSGTGKKKQPYFISRPDHALFSFAGLYDVYRQPDGTDLLSYTIITTTPNATIQPLHDRMAVILPPEDEEEWLDPTVTDPLQVMRLLKPAPAELLTLYPVAPLVNSVHHEGAELIRPLEPPPDFTAATLF